MLKIDLLGGEAKIHQWCVKLKSSSSEACYGSDSQQSLKSFGPTGGSITHSVQSIFSNFVL